MSVAEEIRDVLAQTLQLGDRANDLTESTLLLGNLPELDSMMIATLLAAIEEKFDISIEDDEISAETFKSVGSLRMYVEIEAGGLTEKDLQALRPLYLESRAGKVFLLYFPPSDGLPVKSRLLFIPPSPKN